MVSVAKQHERKTPFELTKLHLVRDDGKSHNCIAMLLNRYST